MRRFLGDAASLGLVGVGCAHDAGRMPALLGVALRRRYARCVATPLNVGDGGLLLFCGDQGADLLGEVAGAEDEGGFGAGEDLLQHFEFFQACELGAFGEQFGGVGLAARGGGFFAALDEVGFRFLGGGDDAVHEFLHVAGEDDVTEADGLHADAELFGAGGQGGADIRADGFLVGEQGVEGFAPDGGAEHELRFAVEGLLVIGRAGDGDYRVGDLESDDEVHTEGDLVGGHDFLARDIRDLLAQVDAFEGQLSGALPEDVEAFTELLDEDAVTVHEDDLVRGDLDAFEHVDGGGVGHHGGELRMLEAQGAGVEGFDTQGIGHLPEGVAAGAEHEVQAFVAPDEGTLGVAEGEDGGFGEEVGAVEEGVEQGVLDVGVEGAEDRDFLGLGVEEACPEAVGAGGEDAVEVALGEEQAAFVVFDVDSEGHGVPPFEAGLGRLCLREIQVQAWKPAPQCSKSQAGRGLAAAGPVLGAESRVSARRGLGFLAALRSPGVYTLGARGGGRDSWTSRRGICSTASSQCGVEASLGVREIPCGGSRRRCEVDRRAWPPHRLGLRRSPLGQVMVFSHLVAKRESNPRQSSYLLDALPLSYSHASDVFGICGGT
jgi:hypothetical protein